MSEPYAKVGNNLIAVPRGDLQILVGEIEAAWDDHSYAKTEDNPGWVRDKRLIDTIRKALKR